MENTLDKHLINPADLVEVDDNSLQTADHITASKTPTQVEPLQGTALKEYNSAIEAEAYSGLLNPSEESLSLPEGMQTGLHGRILRDVSYEDYAKYIDKPFSFISDDAEDLRAYGQGTGEKYAHGITKFVGKTATNVLGSTVGLVYGAGEWGLNLFGEESATKAFFDNDFQRGLDDVNSWMDDKLPNHYTKEEQDYNFLQSAGTANFWANDLTQGLSFVAGAVIAESLSGGLASSAVVAKASAILKGAGKKALGTAGRSTEGTMGAVKSLFRNKQAGNALQTVRQLGTGAMYESGVEARHHYDETLAHLEGMFSDEHKRAPSNKERVGLADIATKSSNAVFAANLALVGYGNYMMFPKLFGKGLNSTKGALKGTIEKEIKDRGRAYKELFKSIGKKEGMIKKGWAVAKTPLYEGAIEEGGQKLMDLAGQGAAYDFYLSKRDPDEFQNVKELLLNMEDSFGAAYGSKEGQKEIGIGMLLAALGLPGRSSTKGKDGKVTHKFEMQGGVWDTFTTLTAQEKAVSDLRTRLERSTTATKAFEKSMDAMIRNKVIDNSKNYAAIIDSPFMYKNAEHDEVFNYIHSRYTAGFESEIFEDIENIRNMPLDQFRESFMYNEKDDLNDAQLKDRRESIATALEERVVSIKETHDSVDRSFINFGEDQKMAITHALSVSKDADAREAEIHERLQSLGVELDFEIEEDKATADKREADAAKGRGKSLWDRIKGKTKAAILSDNSSAVEKVKRKLNIKEITDPVHIEALHRTMLEEVAEVAKTIQEVEQDKSLSKEERDQKLEKLGTEQLQITNRITALTKAIHDGLDPYISAQEQTMLDKWQKANPTAAAESLEEAKQLMKDARKLRARRHRATAMYNELLELREEGDWNPKGWWKVWGMEKGQIVPQPELLLQQFLDTTQEAMVDIGDKKLERLYHTYKGKVVEFEYEYTSEGERKGTKVLKRFYVTEAALESTEDKLLQPIPSMETISFMKQMEALQFEREEALDATDSKNEAKKNVALQDVIRLDKAIELLDAILADPKHVTNTNPYNLSLLGTTSSNITVVDPATMAKEMLESSIAEISTSLKKDIKSKAANLKEINAHLENELARLEEAENANALLIGESETLIKIVFDASHSIRELRAGALKVEARLDALRLDAKALANFKRTKGVQNVRSAEQAQSLILELHDKAFTSKRYSKYSSDLFKSPVAHLVTTLADEKTSFDRAKFFELQTILGEFGEATEELLVEYKPELAALFKKLKAATSALKKISDAVSFSKTETGEDSDNLSPDVSKEDESAYNKAFNKVAEYRATLDNARVEFNAAVNELAFNALQLESMADKLLDHLIYTNNALERFMRPPTKEEKIDTNYVSTKEGEHVSEVIKGNTPTEEFNSAITVTSLRKTAGHHVMAESVYYEYKGQIEAGVILEPALMAQMEAMEDQMRFFAFTSKLNATNTDYLLQAVTRDTVDPKLAGQVYFYHKEGDKESWVRGNTEKTTHRAVGEEIDENILYIVTDKNGKPIRRAGGKGSKEGEGKIIYTSMPTAVRTKIITLPRGKSPKGEQMEVYRYSKRDLIQSSMQSVTDENDVVHYYGPRKASIEAVFTNHRNMRNRILGDDTKLFFEITGHSSPMVKRYAGEKSRPSESIQGATHMIPLKINLGAKGAKSKVTVGGTRHTLNSGMTYMEKDGKLVPMQHNTLSPAAQETIYQLLIKYAENHKERLDGKLGPAAAELVDPTNPDSAKIIHILKGLTFFGNRSIESTAPNFDIVNSTNGFSVNFGEHGTIELQNLLDSVGAESLHEDLKVFLSGMHYNVNHFLLKEDTATREGTGVLGAWNKKYSTKIGKIKGSAAYKAKLEKGEKAAEYFFQKETNKWKKDNPKPAAEAFTEFIEHKIDSSGNLTKEVWTNYTDFLVGNGKDDSKRNSMDEYPLFTNLADNSRDDDLNYHEKAQFSNTYLKHGKDPKTLDEITKERKKEEVKEKEEEVPAEETAEVEATSVRVVKIKFPTGTEAVIEFKVDDMGAIAEVRSLKHSVRGVKEHTSNLKGLYSGGNVHAVVSQMVSQNLVVSDVTTAIESYVAEAEDDTTTPTADEKAVTEPTEEPVTGTLEGIKKKKKQTFQKEETPEVDKIDPNC